MNGSTAQVVLLGVIALATLVMAIIQVGLVVYAARLARKAEALTTRIEQDVRPLIEQATSVVGNAVRVSSLAVTQMERADRVFSDLERRVGETASAIQTTVTTPAREGRALMAGIGAAIGALRHPEKRRARGRVDEEDPLFIG